MGFFQNRRFNLIYLHAGFQALAAYGGESFVFVYLLKAGMAVHIVLLCIAILFGSRLIFRRMVLPATLRFGLRNTLIFGIVMEATAYPVLSAVNGVGPVLGAYLLFWSVSSSFYWTTYHAFVVLIGDKDHRGKQTSVVEFIGTFMSVVAPIISGILLTYFSPLFAFSCVGLAMACSAIPIAFLPNLKIADQSHMPAASRRQARLAMFADGLRSGFFHFTWLIALFITLGSNFVAYGGALSLAGLAGAMMGLFVGKSIDVGKGKRAAQIGYVVLAIAIAARALGYPVAWAAISANALAAVAWPIYNTAFNARVYSLAQQSSCALRFHIIAEGGWDFGTALSCAVSAALLYFGFAFFWPLALALIGCLMGYWVVVDSFGTKTVVEA